MIRLFPSNATDFTTNGLGYLPDATECTVTEERNGAFELEMKYPVSGKRYSDILLRSIIVAKPNPYDDPQPFRIYEISRPMKGLVTVKAAHISYDMNGIPVDPCSVVNGSITAALEALKASTIVPCPFILWTDKTTSNATFEVSSPTGLRACLGGSEGSILDVFKGEYKFDKYMVRLYSERGTNRGVSIRYGKNLTDLTQDENCENVYTGVHGFWSGEVDGSNVVVYTSPLVIPVPGSFNFTRVLALDLSSSFQDKPSPFQLKEKVNEYITNSEIGIPKVNLDISFVNLMDSGEYETVALLETVHLCDTVNVLFEELGVNATAKCIETVYDCITNKYVSISLGDAKSSLTKTLATAPDFKNDFERILKEAKKAIEENNELQMLAIAHATQLITGNLGGNVILHSSTGGETPDEILIMDTKNINTAKKIWRWNLSGLGYSSTGYNGPYSLAATMDGVFVADFIQAGTMSANRIRGGILVLGGPDNGSGEIDVKDSDNNQIAYISNEGISGFGDLKIRKPYDTYKNYYELAFNLFNGLEFENKKYNWYGLRIGTNQPFNPNAVSGWGDVFIIPSRYATSGGSVDATPTWGNTIYSRTGLQLYSQYYTQKVWAKIMMPGRWMRFYANSKLFMEYAPEEGGNHPDAMKIKVPLTCESYLFMRDPFSTTDDTPACFDPLGYGFYSLQKVSSSSIRYKEVKADMTAKDVEKLYNIQPVFAKYKNGYLKDGDERNGIYYPMFIAEDVEKYFPEGVNHNKDGSVENWNNRALVPAMFQMIKSQKEQIDNLQTQINELKELIQNG